jgi:peroxiredoxin
MKRVFVLLSLLPALAFAQGKQKSQPKPPVTPAHNPAAGYVINGGVSGFPDGTTVDLLNGTSGATEVSSTIVKNKFIIKGSVPSPDFKILLFNKKPPFITLFLDNSAVKVKGTKDKIDKALVTGSKSHSDFDAFNKMLEPYKSVFDEGVPPDSAKAAKAMLLTGEFAMQHPNSYVAPLALIRFNQLADDPNKTEILYNAMLPGVKASAMGVYVGQLITEAKKNAIGTLLPDFTETDTSGRPVSLSSLRGKFVLVDFWASWCGPCRAENPNVVQAYNRYKNRNFTVLGVSLDKAKPAWIDAINIDNLTWTHVSDLLGWSNAAALQYQIYSIPQNFLIDPEGKILGKNLRGPALERKLAKVLK